MAKQITIKTQYGTTIFDSGMMDLINKIRAQAVGIGYYGTKKDKIVAIVRGRIIKKISSYDRFIEIKTKKYETFHSLIDLISESEGRFVIKNGKVKYIYDSMILHLLDHFKPALETIEINNYRPNNNIFVGLNKNSHSSHSTMNTVINFTEVGTFLFKNNDKNLFYNPKFYEEIDKIGGKIFNI